MRIGLPQAVTKSRPRKGSTLVTIVKSQATGLNFFALIVTGQNLAIAKLHINSIRRNYKRKGLHLKCEKKESGGDNSYLTLSP